MNAIRPAALVALALIATVPAAARAQDGEPRRYDLDLGFKPGQGTKVQFAESEDMAMDMTIRAGEQIVNQINQTRGRRLEGERTALRVEDGKLVEQSATFTHASEAENGIETPYSFEGRTVLARRPGEPDRFRWKDGSPVLDEKDIQGLEQLFGRARDEDEPSSSEVFAPDHPVAVGESWTPDLEALVKAFGIESGSGEDAVDMAKSSAKLTLAAVEEREGSLFGRVEGEIVLALKQMGPMPLEDTILAKMKLTIDACIDGTRPDGVMNGVMTMQGTSRITGPGGQALDIDVDMRVTMNEKRDLIGGGPAKPPAPESERLGPF